MPSCSSSAVAVQVSPPCLSACLSICGHETYWPAPRFGSAAQCPGATLAAQRHRLHRQAASKSQGGPDAFRSAPPTPQPPARLTTTSSRAAPSHHTLAVLEFAMSAPLRVLSWTRPKCSMTPVLLPACECTTINQCPFCLDADRVTGGLVQHCLSSALFEQLGSTA